MSIGSFLKLVEIQTKVASIIPYLIGTVFSLYKFNNFNIKNSLLLFSSMLIFDMTVTAINNYNDYKKAIKKHGFGYEIHNAIVMYNLNPKIVLAIIFIMLLLSSLLGVLLFLNTNLVILLVGILCFSIGILYSFGPIPISRTPFGEIFSGITMGFFITFLAIYIHIIDDGTILIALSEDILSLSLNIKILISIIIVSIPCISGIANIMLANNICDIEDDIINKRYTLPVFIGKEKSLFLFALIYYVGFIAIILGIFLKILPLTSLIVLAVLKPVNKNIKDFIFLQSKKDTFVLAVKNFILLNITYIVSILFAIILY